MADGAIIKLRRHGNPTGPRIVLSHGNGLAADLYYPFWSLLADRFDIVLYDLRNHGWNPIGDRAAHVFPGFVDDSQRINASIDRHFGAKPRIGVPFRIRAGRPG
jgi:pimeloyl-ACP methyl ester carboxylesterase